MSSDTPQKAGFFRTFLLCQIPLLGFLSYAVYSVPAQMAAERRARQREQLAGKSRAAGPVDLRVDCGNPMLVSIFAAGLLGMILFIDVIMWQAFKGSRPEEPVQEMPGADSFL